MLNLELARALRGHPQSLAADRNLSIDPSDSADEFWKHDKILLRRAFRGFSRIRIKEERGGRSTDCRVWRVDARRGEGACEPFIAKAGRRGDLQVEFDTYRDMVRDFMPFPFRAPVLESQFVKGGGRALLVSAFVTRAQRLDEYLAWATHPEHPVASIFCGALANSRRNSNIRKGISLGALYVDEQLRASRSIPESAIGIKPLLPSPQHLEAVARRAILSKRLSMTPEILWKKMTKSSANVPLRL